MSSSRPESVEDLAKKVHELKMNPDWTPSYSQKQTMKKKLKATISREMDEIIKMHEDTVTIRFENRTNAAAGTCYHMVLDLELIQIELKFKFTWRYPAVAPEVTIVRQQWTRPFFEKFDPNPVKLPNFTSRETKDIAATIVAESLRRTCALPPDWRQLAEQTEKEMGMPSTEYPPRHPLAQDLEFENWLEDKMISLEDARKFIMMLEQQRSLTMTELAAIDTSIGTLNQFLSGELLVQGLVDQEVVVLDEEMEQAQ